MKSCRAGAAIRPTRRLPRAYGKGGPINRDANLIKEEIIKDGKEDYFLMGKISCGNIKEKFPMCRIFTVLGRKMNNIAKGAKTVLHRP